MAVDTKGEFHPVWPDARNGTWQIYTARIQVRHAGDTLQGARPDTTQLHQTLLGDRTVLTLDGSVTDTSAAEVTLWARVRNISPDTLYGPFAVEIAALGSPDTLTFPGRGDGFWPVPINASNGQQGVGARFDFVGAAGALDLLPPGDITEALPFRFRIRQPLWNSVQMRAIVRGYVRK